MPRDDWAKYASKDRGRRARLDGSGIVISKAGKRRRKKKKAGLARRSKKSAKITCRCCGGKKFVGRENICTSCYKRFKHQVHAVALARSGPFQGGTVLPLIGLQPTTGTRQSGNPSTESEMTHK